MTTKCRFELDMTLHLKDPDEVHYKFRCWIFHEHRKTDQGSNGFYWINQRLLWP